jgi:hypothetical protein
MNSAYLSRTSVVFLFWSAVTAAGTGSQAIFGSPDEAANALVGAVKSGNYTLFLSIAGRQMAAFWSTGDPERDEIDRDRFLDSAGKSAIKMKAPNLGQMVYVGDPAQPFPAPLVFTGSGWRFDGERGLSELTRRRIRRNETAIVELCRRFREAEYTYLGMARDKSPAFAERINSTPGHHDGLFWAGEGDLDESLLGPAFATAAAAEPTPGGRPRPLFGYYFKILTAQGPAATGGALDYHTKGRLRKGFALIAWPAEYGVDGVQTFLVNHFGDVFQKDLGSNTTRLAGVMTVFNPDPSWCRFTGDD